MPLQARWSVFVGCICRIFVIGTRVWLRILAKYLWWEPGRGRVGSKKWQLKLACWNLSVASCLQVQHWLCRGKRRECIDFGVGASLFIFLGLRHGRLQRQTGRRFEQMWSVYLQGFNPDNVLQLPARFRFECQTGSGRFHCGHQAPGGPMWVRGVPMLVPAAMGSGKSFRFRLGSGGGFLRKLYRKFWW